MRAPIRAQPLHNDKRIDALCEDAVKEADPAARAEKMKRVFDALDKDVGFPASHSSTAMDSSPGIPRRSPSGRRFSRRSDGLGPVYRANSARPAKRQPSQSSRRLRIPWP